MLPQISGSSLNPYEKLIMAIIRSLDDQNPLYLWPPSHTGGPLGLDPFLRQAMLDSVIDLITVGNGVAMTGSTSRILTLRLTGDLSYDGSGKFSGISGTIESEAFHDTIEDNYEITGLNISVYDYLHTATWDSVLSGNDVVYGTSVRDELSPGAGFDTVYGGDGNDSILGGLNGDLIYGGAGNDVLRGGNGLDKLFGDTGDDELVGAKGTDTLTGGGGADRFVFNSVLDGVINIDTITDFEIGVDTIKLSPTVFTTLGRSQRSFSLSDQYTSGPDAGIGRIVYDSQTGKLSYDADGAGGGASVAFAVIGVDIHPSSLASVYFFFGDN